VTSRLVAHRLLPKRPVFHGFQTPAASFQGAGRQEEIVKRERGTWPRLTAVGLVVSLLTLVAAPIASAEGAAPAKPASLAAAASAHGAALGTQLAAKPTIRAQATPQAQGAESKPFLKSTKGVVALVAFAGALGFAAYSLNNDRVSSPGRK
jgi:hypothetical protein